MANNSNKIFLNTLSILILMVMISLILVNTHAEERSIITAVLHITDSTSVGFGYCWTHIVSVVKKGMIVMGNVVGNGPVKVEISLSGTKIYESNYESLVRINLKFDYDGILSIRVCNLKPDIEVSDSLSVLPGSSVKEVYYIPANVQVKFIAYISGGYGNDADIRIYDPDGYVISGGRQSNMFKYKFTTSKNGYYVFEFGNTFSTISSKTIAYSITGTSAREVSINLTLYDVREVTSFAILPSIGPSDALLIGIIAVLAVLITILSIMLIKRRRVQNAS
jgi:hypothetical protein